MPTYRHPSADPDAGGSPPARIHVARGDKRPVADDGTFDVPAYVAESIADRFDTTVAAMRVNDADASEADVEAEAAAVVADDEEAPDTCEVVKSDGEVCGRDRPCPYHD